MWMALYQTIVFAGLHPDKIPSVFQFRCSLSQLLRYTYFLFLILVFVDAFIIICYTPFLSALSLPCSLFSLCPSPLFSLLSSRAHGHYPKAYGLQIYLVIISLCVSDDSCFVFIKFLLKM